MPDENRFAVTLTRRAGYGFDARFDGRADVEPITVDEPVPLGSGTHANAARLVGAAVGHCLGASLLFCLEKAKQPVSGMTAEVAGAVRRNEKGRWRLARLDVQLRVDLGAGEPERVRRCLELFEDYCVVTPVIRAGVEVAVRVTDPRGNELLRPPEGP